MLDTCSATITTPQGDRELGVVELTAGSAVPSIVAAAAAAHPAWASRPVHDRAALLDDAAAMLDDPGRVEELALLLAAESGKPLAQAHFEITAAIGLLRANAHEARRRTGAVLPTEGNPGTERDLAYTRREPLGVVAAILPFNFPVELFVEKCAAALVTGNAVVCKPPLEAPLAVQAFVDALHETGVPAEVLAVVHGDVEPAAALATAPGVDAISLTGSTDAGIAVATATAALLRPLHLELGGNNACLVLPDADLGLVADEVMFGRFMMNGQACSATKRVIVVGDAARHDELAERLAARIGQLTVGPADDPETAIGPLITPQAAARVAAQVRTAVDDGARLVVGGERDGAFVTPALLAATPAAAAVARDDEIFGPVATLIPAVDAAEALRIANASSFGLMASVFTQDTSLALALAERLQAGGVVINGSDNYRPPIIPFGGVKRSGVGREGIGYTQEELTRTKTIVFRRIRADHPELER